jgi:hypothetical protein
MKLVAICSGLVCVVLGAVTSACGGGAASGPLASMPAAQSPDPQPSAQREATSQDGVEIGPSCGESWRPELHLWQSTTLTAIGRDGQYELFDYVFVDGGLYVGLRKTSLGLTDAELAAARSVQVQFARGPVEARERGDLLLGRPWASKSGALARTE